MSGTAPPGDDEGVEYFRAVERIFIRLRGAPLLLSPADYREARRWFEKGIPLQLVRQALEEVFARRAARGTEGRVQSLRYCAPAVEKAWRELRALQAPAGSRTAPPIDVPARLENLARRVPDCFPDASDVRQAIVGLRGSVTEVEAELAALDTRVLEAAARGLPPAVRRKLEQEVAAELGAWSGRIAEEGQEALRRQVLRRRLGLPRLSLFEPERPARG